MEWEKLSLEDKLNNLNERLKALEPKPDEKKKKK